jgi:hypothetical protein
MPRPRFVGLNLVLETGIVGFGSAGAAPPEPEQRQDHASEEEVRNDVMHGEAQPFDPPAIGTWKPL